MFSECLPLNPYNPRCSGPWGMLKCAKGVPRACRVQDRHAILAKSEDPTIEPQDAIVLIILRASNRQ